MVNEHPCDVCTGTGKPLSGRPCICAGEGTSSAEKAGLRTRIVLLEDECMALRGALQSALDWMGRPAQDPYVAAHLEKAKKHVSDVLKETS